MATDAPPSSVSSRRTTLAARLFLWFGGANLAVSLVALAVISIGGRQIVYHRLESLVERDAATATQVLEGRVALITTTANMMALDAEDGGLADIDVSHAYLPRVVENTPLIFGAALCEARTGAVLDSISAPYVYRDGGHLERSRLTQVPRLPYLRQVLTEDRSAWSKPYTHPFIPVRVMTYATPVHRNGRVVGFASTDLSVSQLETEISQALSGEHWYMFAIGRDGEVVATSQSATGLSRAQVEQTLGTTVLQGPAGLMQVTRDPILGERAWVYHRPISRGHYFVCTVYPEREVLAELRYAKMFLTSVALLQTFVLLGLVYAIARAISRPVRALREAARAASSGDLEVQMPIPRANDELADIPVAFNRMMDDLRAYMARERETTIERERTQSEMATASRVQTAFQDQERWPRVASVDVSAQTLQARQVGGDFYDFFVLDDTRVGIVLGDSSGHGISAALFMAVCRTLVRAYAQESSSPSECLTRVNRRLYDENEAMMFVTAVYAVLDTCSGALTLSSAGHPPAYVLRADGALEKAAVAPCRPLGIRPDSVFTQHALRLHPGDRLVLYSDGIHEAENAALARFGSERLEAVLRDVATAPCAEIVAAVDGGVRDFVHDAEISDDRSVLALRWRGPRLEVAPRVDSLAQVNHWIESLLREVPRETLLRVQTALEETFVNICTHGENGENEVIILTAEVEADAITIIVEDEGAPFDPTAPHAHAAPRQIGGRGLDLIRAAVDEATYVREGTRNLLRLRKRLGVQAPHPPAENRDDEDRREA